MVLDNDESIYTFAMGLLYFLKDKDPYRYTGRLAFVLDRENFDRFIDTMGGMTIKVPTRQEINEMLKALVYYQSRFVEGKSFFEACRVSGTNIGEVPHVTRIAKTIKSYMEEINEESLKPSKDVKLHVIENLMLTEGDNND